MTTETKVTHTPGPWIAVKADIHGESSDRWSVCTEGPRQFFIATIENGAPGDIVATEEVNAHLIAAAPDMLEALEELFKFATELAPLLFVVTPDGRFDRALRAADAAIAKGKGSV